MNASRALTLLMAALTVIATGGPAVATEVSRHGGRCDVVATTGRAEAGRDRESGETCARVDNRPRPHFLRPPVRKGIRPIDRLRSLGEGARQVADEREARRQANEDGRRGR